MVVMVEILIEGEVNDRIVDLLNGSRTWSRWSTRTLSGCCWMLNEGNAKPASLTLELPLLRFE